METSICGVHCAECEMYETCGGCRATGGRPFGAECVVAACCLSGGHTACSECPAPCRLKQQLMAEFNALGIEGLPEVKELFSLKGSSINPAYPLANGTTVQLLENDKIYLGARLHKAYSTRCYGLVADEDHLLVCEYGENGAAPEIVLYKKRGVRLA